MDKSEIKQIENMIEVVVRSIPKERQARDTFLAASREAKCEMARILFERLADQEEQHEAKLRASLEILKQEMDEAKGKWLEAAVVCEEIEDKDIPVKEKIKDLETVMEVVMRMIPKEHDAAQLYISTSHSAKRELTRKLFEWLAEQEIQHESKLRGILDLLKEQLHALKHK